MRQLTLARTNFNKHNKQALGQPSWLRWSRWCHGVNCARLWSRIIKAGERAETDRNGANAATALSVARFNLSDPAAEEALYDSISMHQFVGIDPGRERVPDEP